MFYPNVGFTSILTNTLHVFYGALISFGNIFFSVPKVFFYVWWPSNRFKKAWVPELWPCLTEFFAYVLNVSYVKINADDLCPFLGQTPEQNHSLQWATAPITFYENAFIIKFLINEDFLYLIHNNLLNITMKKLISVTTVIYQIVV